jgi:HAD superfamily hydrolase (TIGR01509 family)
MLPAIDAVVFDMDGLMFDTEALFFRVSCEVLEARGSRFTHEMMAAMIGRRAVEAGHILKTMSGLDVPADELLAEVRARFLEVVDTDVSTSPGLVALLDHLKRQEIPAAVATSSRLVYAERLLNGHGLRDRFEFVLGSEDVEHGKPNPEIYLKAAARLGKEPRSVLVLEDSRAGVEAARAAGAYVVGVPHEHSPAEGLHRADLIVPRLDDPALLARLARSEAA